MTPRRGNGLRDHERRGLADRRGLLPLPRGPCLSVCGCEVKRDGNPAELAVAAHLRSCGYLTASRRHEGGAGDHLAIHPTRPPLLIETKGGRSGPWANFRTDDRAAMIETALTYNATPLLAYVLSVERREIMYLEVPDWPN